MKPNLNTMNENINFVAFDFETAYGQKNACQLGLVVVEKGQIIEEKSWLIQPPQNKISDNCTKIHGITPSMTKDAPNFGELWSEIKPYFEHRVIVHHSDGFDIRILNQELEYYDIEPVRHLASESTLSLFSSQYSRSLLALCKAFNIEMDKHHNALSDARCCAYIFLKYLNGENPNYNLIKDVDLKKKSSIAFYDKDRKIASDIYKQDLSIVSNKNTLFYKQKIVISGTFVKYPVRNDLGLLLKEFGADIDSAISSKTNFFVVGSDCGPKKMEKAQNLIERGSGLQIIQENELYTILENINHG